MAVSVKAVLDLVARMRRGAISRNRDFDIFARAEGEAARARRIHRYLRALEKDLADSRARIGNGITLLVERASDGGRRITIEVPEVRMRRTAILSEEEYALLREHPDARALLDSAVEPTGS